MQSLQEIAEAIKGVKSAVIFTHTRPDGDTLGSGVALYFALKQLNIDCEICNDSDTIPDKYLFLDGIGRIKKTIPEEVLTAADAFIAVDCAEAKRMGTWELDFTRFGKKKLTINIDHHISNTKYAKLNYVRDCAANCLNVAQLIPMLGVEIDKQIANALMMGIVTDSGNFSHSDVRGEDFRVAGAMVDSGADQTAINYNMFKKQSKARAKLYGMTMSEIRYLLDDKLAIICITKDMFKASGADQSVTEGFVDFPLSVECVEVSVAIMEVKYRQYKLSLRSKGKVNVNAIAAVFGGGGHVLASGCMLFGDLEEVIDKLRYTVSQYMD